MSKDWEARSIFHININCTDRERSVAFYEQLGFRRVLATEGYTGPADGSYLAIGLTDQIEHDGTAVLFLGDDSHQTRLILMEWKQPVPPPHTPPVMNQIGVPRIGVWVKNLEALVKDLSARGVEFVSPLEGPYPQRSIKWLVSVKDPDGFLIELLEFLPGGRHIYDEWEQAHAG